jgi:hypothetical protein
MPSTPGGAAALLDRTRPARWPGWSGVPAGRPARRPARHPGLPWTGLCTRLDDLRRTLEERDEELAAAREANRTMMAELNHR